MTEPLRARPASPSASAAPVAAATAVSLSATARSHPVIPPPTEPGTGTGEQHPLRLAGLAALFGLGRRRSAPTETALPDDDPYVSYLRWASGGAAEPARDAEETAAA
ncbi:hypothetical protein PQI23_11500 [Leucobacter sp. USCH14]|uniref:hypothetical protein n=1 Tax=Leucobacter sp. USCH14 TaxID=3024838 RepID=UPI0030AB25E3